MKIIDFNELKAQRNGILTPKAIIDNIVGNISDVKEVVVIIKRQNDQIIHGVSEMNNLNALGLCEVGKTLILGDMWEEHNG